MNFMLNQEEKSAINAQKGKVKFIINTEKVKTNYKIYTAEGKQPYILVKFSLRETIEETSKKITNQELSGYEKAVEKSSEKIVKQVLLKMQKANVDPIVLDCTIVPAILIKMTGKSGSKYIRISPLRSILRFKLLIPD